MEPNKILSATLIDVIFDDRNKEYGAYELRKTYSRRIKKALLITMMVTALAFEGATLAGSVTKNDAGYQIHQGYQLTEIPEEKKPAPIPEPEKKPEIDQVKTKKFTAPLIVDAEEITEPPASIEDLDSSRIGLETINGKPYVFTSIPPEEIGGGKGIIEKKNIDEQDEIKTTVDVPAKFEGSWIKFLQKNLNAEIPLNNGAGPGRYSVVVQFIVDKEGNVSDIKALTNHGYGVEEEALRVLRKAPKWQPAIAAGYTVKAYHKQVIVFEVLEE